MTIQSLEKKVFSKLYGHPCWHPARSLGSVITFNFGKPRLEIGKVHEPISSNFPGKGRFRHRSVSVSGDWFLTIECCGWQITQEAERLARWTSSKRRKEMALSILHGQALTKIEIRPEKAETIFTFDLGGVIKTFPYDDELNEMWTLSIQSSRWFTFCSDGTYSYVAKTTSPDEVVQPRSEGELR